MKSPYNDPNDEEKERYAFELANSRHDPHQLLQTVKRIFEGWVLHELDEYAPGLEKLNDNWGLVIEKIKKDTGENISRQKILIVSTSYITVKDVGNQYSFDKDKSLLYLAFEYLVKQGYVVKTINDLIPCPKCGRAILSKDGALFYRRPFSNKCSQC